VKGMLAIDALHLSDNSASRSFFRCGKDLFSCPPATLSQHFFALFRGSFAPQYIFIFPVDGGLSDKSPIFLNDCTKLQDSFFAFFLALCSRYPPMKVENEEE
jgi:hypothetical protein